MRKLVLAVLLVLLAAIGYVAWTWDFTSPAVSWRPPKVVGKKTEIPLDIQDKGRGLRSVQITVAQGGNRRVILERRFAEEVWPWQMGPARAPLKLTAAQLLGSPPLKQGEFQLQIVVTDQPNLGIWDNTTWETATLQIDTRPPQLAALSQQHYIKQGGSEAILYRVSPDAKRSGVQVGANFFPGYAVPGGFSPEDRISLFALAWNQPVDTPMFLWAEDEAGNRSQVNFWKRVSPSAFRKRSMPITDSFLQAVVPEILSRTDEISEKSSLIESYLEINRTLRRLNNDRISAFAAESASRPLWTAPFLQLSNSQVEAVFADQRTYYYQGRQIDRQTHLGFDLAATAQSPVEASNDGIVLFADYLGIYGNCVIVDHGLGLESLYGHLSSIAARKGDHVKLGQSLGRTGQTGLAGGDHLHFSLLLQGVQVNPIEWWDPQWIRLHVLSKLGGKD
jgi:murein DD-endopeptidase MepM/ murein hydrolase activator NlpD